MIPPSGLPTISPLKRGRLASVTRSTYRTLSVLRNRQLRQMLNESHESISPLEGEMSGRTEGGEAPRSK